MQDVSRAQIVDRQAGADASEPSSPDSPPRSRFAAQLRGPLGFVLIPVAFLAGNTIVAGYLLPLGALLVLAWAFASRTPLRDIGYARPRNWLFTIAVGIAIGVVLKFAMKAVVMPVLGAPPTNIAYQHLVGNTHLIVATLWTMIIVGFAEETLWRGFLFERLRRLIGDSRRAAGSMLVLTSLLFGLAHYPNQGWPGVEQSIVTGLVFGGACLVTRNLWLAIIAHSSFDLAAYALIFWGLETRVATFFVS